MLLLTKEQFERLVLDSGSSSDAVDRVESLEIGIEDLAERKSNFRQGDYRNEPEYEEDPEFVYGMLCELRVLVEERYTEDDGAVLISWEIWSDDPTLDKEMLKSAVENWLANY